MFVFDRINKCAHICSMLLTYSPIQGIELMCEILFIKIQVKMIDWIRKHCKAAVRSSEAWIVNWRLFTRLRYKEILYFWISNIKHETSSTFPKKYDNTCFPGSDMHLFCWLALHHRSIEQIRQTWDLIKVVLCKYSRCDVHAPGTRMGRRAHRCELIYRRSRVLNNS